MAEYDEADALMETIIQAQTSDDSDNSDTQVMRNASKRGSESSESESIDDRVADFTAPPLKIRHIAPLPSAVHANEVCVSKSDLANLIQTVLELKNTVLDVSGKLTSVTDQLNTVTGDLRKVKVALRNVNEPNDVPKVVAFKCKEKLPLRTYEDLLTFEANECPEEFKLFLLTVGGNSPTRMMANLVAAVYSMELQVSTTWKRKRCPSGPNRHCRRLSLRA